MQATRRGMSRATMTLEEVCDTLQLSKDTIERLRKEGTFPEPMDFSKTDKARRKLLRWRTDDIGTWLIDQAPVMTPKG